MMSNNSLISLIQNSHGNSKILQKILNSAAYKELPLEQQASTLLTIIENSERNKEVSNSKFGLIFSIIKT